MSKAQQLLEEVRKRKEAEAAAATAGDTGTSALDELMGGITDLDAPDTTTPDTATPENEVTTEVTEPAQDGFITIVPEAPAPTGIQVTVEDAPAVMEQAPATPTTEAPPAAKPAPKPRQTKQAAPKVTETPATEGPATDAPLTRAQKRTLDEIEAGRRVLAERRA